jgi:hypothetical protein
MPALDCVAVRQTVADQLHTPTWQRFAQVYIRNGLGVPRGDLKGTHVDWMSGEIPSLNHALARAVRMAENFYVTPEMTRLVDARADAWADDETWNISELPTTAGFMHVPAAIRDTGSDGWPVGASVAMWHVVGDRLRLVFFWSLNDRALTESMDPDDFKLMPPYPLLQVYDLPADGGPLPLAMRPSAPLPEGMRGELNLALDDDDYHVRGTPRVQMWLADNDVQVDLVPDRLVIWLLSCLRLMRERIPNVSRQGSPVSVQRGMQQRKLRNTHVTVIEFRHREPGPEQGGTHEYSHRFLRRGHHRRVWAKNPETGQLEQRQVWIKPTVVLAHREDLPMLFRDHVNELRR